MKLRNKKTGEIKRVGFLSDYQNDDGTEIGFRVADTLDVYSYNSLAELNADWEDYEEPKAYWYIDDAGVMQIDQILSSEINMRKSIGNYFETKEEAEKAVEKLKAWKRLKDKGFRTYDICKSPTGFVIHFEVDWEHRGVMEDLDLLFGGEE